MQVLIIDNFDSFTYNLHHTVNQFANKCSVIRGDRVSESDVMNHDKIIFSPGPSLPLNHPIIFDILQGYSNKKSILGICLGHQAIAEYFGATLRNMKFVKHGITSNNTIVLKDVLFNNIPDTFIVGHYHSWVVDKDSAPSIIQITSENEDGLMMSFRHNQLDVCGLQFHPESILTQYGNRIIKNWIKS